MNITIERAVTLREQAANIIRKMIVAGVLKAGSPVSVRQISQRLGVSASPVKEALRILEVEGLVYSLARKGFYVSESSAENMMQISKILASMEGIAAFFAAENAREEDICAMETALTSCDEQFHICIHRAAGNEYLMSLLRNMKNIDKTVRKANVVCNEEEAICAQKEHLAILNAIKKRDSTLAERLMVDHVRREDKFI